MPLLAGGLAIAGYYMVMFTARRLGLAGMLTIATACGSSSTPTSPTDGTGGVDYTINIKNNAYSPNPLTMKGRQDVE